MERSTFSLVVPKLLSYWFHREQQETRFSFNAFLPHCCYLSCLPTFPCATSSLWAADADFTRALVAAAMDLAASRICSSKSRVSSACYNQERTTSHIIHLKALVFSSWRSYTKWDKETLEHTSKFSKTCNVIFCKGVSGRLKMGVSISECKY